MQWKSGIFVALHIHERLISYTVSESVCLKNAFENSFPSVDKKRMINAEVTEKSIIYQSPGQHRDHFALNNLSSKAEK